MNTRRGRMQSVECSHIVYVHFLSRLKQPGDEQGTNSVSRTLTLWVYDLRRWRRTATTVTHRIVRAIMPNTCTKLSY